MKIIYEQPYNIWIMRKLSKIQRVSFSLDNSVDPWERLIEVERIQNKLWIKDVEKSPIKITPTLTPTLTVIDYQQKFLFKFRILFNRFIYDFSLITIMTPFLVMLSWSDITLKGKFVPFKKIHSLNMCKWKRNANSWKIISIK